MSRHDNVGFFWEDIERVSTKGQRQERTGPLPEIPHTGWAPPTEFPCLRGAKRIAVDIETKDLDLLVTGPGVRRGGHIVGIGVGVDDGGRWYFPMRHEVQTELNFDPDVVLRWAKEELGRPEQEKVGANLLYDCDFLEHEGVHVAGRLLDVQIAEPLIDENALEYNLNALGRKYLGENKVDEVLYRWAHAAYGGTEGRRQAGNIYRCPPSLVGPYVEGDVDLPLRILREQEKVIAAQDLHSIFRLETDLLPILLAMKKRGVRVDLARANQVYDELTAQLIPLQKSVGIDVYSRDDLEKFCKRKSIAYPLTEKSINKKGEVSGGNASFTAAFLEAATDPNLQQVVRIRKLLKARDVFVKSYIIDKNINGRLHCQFNPLRGDDTGAVSGRFSSSYPNLQNIPNRDKVIGPLIRSLFIPDNEDELWCRADQSQIEFRFLTHYAMGPGAEETRQQYRDNPKVDFHRMVAAIAQIERDPAKTINFGLVYGMGEPLMAHNLGRTLEEVKPMFEQYHERLPFIRYTYNAVSRVASNRGYIKTILGRRRRFEAWEVKKKIYDTEEEASRHGIARRAFTHKALNALLQGSAADQMKKAMVDLWNSGMVQEFGAPGLTVHDEIDWSLPRGRPEVVAEVKRIMQDAVKLNVPVITDVGTGDNWQKAK